MVPISTEIQIALTRMTKSCPIEKPKINGIKTKNIKAISAIHFDFFILIPFRDRIEQKNHTTKNEDLILEQTKQMTFVDLFAGIGGFRTGFERAGFKCIWSSEWDKWSQKTYEANFGEVPNGDITKVDAKDIPEHDVLIGGFPCFIAGTMILTKKGYKQIEKIIIGDEVLTHLLRWRKVTATMKRNDAKVFQAFTKLSSATCTEEHPFYVKKDKKSIPEFIPAKDLKKGMLLGQTFINSKDYENGKITWTRYEISLEEKQKTTVYNLSVEEDESYVANNFIVHNCQAFSSSGKKLGFEDSRGTLFFDVARIIKEKQPKAFVLENVKNLKTHDKGRTFDVIFNTLRDLGYFVHYKILDASTLVPQHRERIFIVGFKEQLNFYFPEMTGEKKKLRDILEKEVDPKYTTSDTMMRCLERHKARHMAKGNGFGFTIANLDGISRTLLARYCHDGSDILIPQEGKNPRKMTPRECARLMGFPEDFKIVCSNPKAIKQFGNSVVVPLIEQIAINVKKALENETPEPIWE